MDLTLQLPCDSLHVWRTRVFVCLVSERPRQQLGYIADRPQDGRLAVLSAATHETEWGDHDFCLSRSHYTDTDPTSRERGSNPGLPDQELRALPTELPHPTNTSVSLIQIMILLTCRSCYCRQTTRQWY